jgi:hypothetical protein
MKDFERRLQKLETNLRSDGIPAAEKVQVIVGRMKGGEFIPNIPGDSEETRKRILVERYGTDAGAIYIQLIDYAGD